MKGCTRDDWCRVAGIPKVPRYAVVGVAEFYDLQEETERLIFLVRVPSYFPPLTSSSAHLQSYKTSYIDIHQAMNPAHHRISPLTQASPENPPPTPP
jgi:hypothetical protein